MNVVSIGEVLWDVVGQTEYLGGATFNFSAHLQKLGHTVSFVSAVGNDERGRRILSRMRELGMVDDYVRIDPSHPTGIASVKVATGGQPSFVLERPAAYDFPQLAEMQFQRLSSQRLDWIYFGTLQQISSTAKNLTSELLARIPRAPRFYDINLRPNCHTPSLLRELMGLATVVKLNDAEVTELSQMFDRSCASLEDFCRTFSAMFGWKTVCVTRGPDGCAVLTEDQYCEVEGYSVSVVDTVGSGDAFAAAFLHGLGQHWPVLEIADFANRIGALVAASPGALPPWTVEQARTLNNKSHRVESA